jgi:hypothetical protein
MNGRRGAISHFFMGDLSTATVPWSRVGNMNRVAVGAFDWMSAQWHSSTYFENLSLMPDWRSGSTVFVMADWHNDRTRAL